MAEDRDKWRSLASTVINLNEMRRAFPQPGKNYWLRKCKPAKKDSAPCSSSVFTLNNSKSMFVGEQ
jgi:hypothetical protein